MLATAIISGVSILSGPIIDLIGSNKKQETPVYVAPVPQKDNSKKLIIGTSIGVFILIIALYFIIKARKNK